jgi:CheY-like chemotaxis protein
MMPTKRPDAQASHAAGSRRRAFPFPKAQRVCVLVVEDDSEIADALVALLEDEGFVAQRACDGDEALQILGEMSPRPGLILLDLMMPRMDGWQFRDAQLENAELRSIPVVVLSAIGLSLAERELKAFAAVLRKPVAADTLIGIVQHHFQRFNFDN